MNKQDFEINKLFLKHDQSVAVYSHALQIKRQYFEDLSKSLIHNKLEYANKVYSNLEKTRKKTKFTEFSISDLMGIEKVELLELDANDSILEAYPFHSITDLFFEKLLELISSKSSIHINFYLLNLINFETRFSIRDTYIEEIKSAELPRRVTIKGLLFNPVTQDDFSPFKSNDHSNTRKVNELMRKSQLNFTKIIKEPKPNKKKQMADTIASFKHSFIPNNLKQDIYMKTVPNHNMVDESFYKYYMNVDPRMPKHVETLIDCNVKTMFCIFSFFDTEMQDEIINILKIFYNYRPDIGYKSGMEIYGLILAMNLHSHQLLNVFTSLVLDYNLLFGVFKGIDFLNESYKEKLFGRLAQVRQKTSQVNVDKFNDLIWNFFVYSISNCFYCLFSLKSLK